FAEQGIDPTSMLASNPFAAAGGFGSAPLTGKDMGISGIAEGVAKSISGIVRSIFDGTLGNVLAGIVGGIFGTVLGGAGGGLPSVLGKVAKAAGSFGGIPGAVAGFAIGFGVNELSGNRILGFFAGAVTYLIIIIAIFAALLRLWFQLIKSYIYVLINVVLAPFYIASGLIPGRSGFGTWIRSILSNLSVFPVTIAMFLFGKAFMSGFTKQDPSTTPFVPPLTGDFLDPANFASIIGLGIILLTPEVVNIVRDALKAPEFKYTAAIGRSVAGGLGVITGTVRGTAGGGFAALKGAMPLAGEKGLTAVLRRVFR
ncbi:MAG TPA: hypothetical protein VI387_11320, partial [Candidatus Brocadiales bacterium]|nr:hypothetical protein [Candidatus Brocadiales bacterium]